MKELPVGSIDLGDNLRLEFMVLTKLEHFRVSDSSTARFGRPGLRRPVTKPQLHAQRRLRPKTVFRASLASVTTTPRHGLTRLEVCRFDCAAPNGKIWISIAVADTSCLGIGVPGKGIMSGLCALYDFPTSGRADNLRAEVKPALQQDQNTTPSLCEYFGARWLQWLSEFVPDRGSIRDG